MVQRTHIIVWVLLSYYLVNVLVSVALMRTQALMTLAGKDGQPTGATGISMADGVALLHTEPHTVIVLLASLSIFQGPGSYSGSFLQGNASALALNGMGTVRVGDIDRTIVPRAKSLNAVFKPLFGMPPLQALQRDADVVQHFVDSARAGRQKQANDRLPNIVYFVCESVGSIQLLGRRDGLIDPQLAPNMAALQVHNVRSYNT